VKTDGKGPKGVGESDTPLVRYTTTDMAKDLMELCDHLGWKGDQQLNLVGVSLGGRLTPHTTSRSNVLTSGCQGMIAQEL
jgi:pimeloyl-ACP methyl ester carboxylesterase